MSPHVSNGPKEDVAREPWLYLKISAVEQVTQSYGFENWTVQDTHLSACLFYYLWWHLYVWIFARTRTLLSKSGSVPPLSGILGRMVPAQPPLFRRSTGSGSLTSVLACQTSKRTLHHIWSEIPSDYSMDKALCARIGAIVSQNVQSLS
jgi:hypothetical protein